MDFDLFRSVNDFAARHDAFEDALKGYSHVSPALFVALLVVLAFGVRSWRTEARRGVAHAGLAAALALAAGQLIAGAVDRARPYEAHPGRVHLFIPRSADPSFPSDHVTAAFAIALAIWLRNRAWGSVALAMTAVLSVGRVALGTHYPGDVAGGALLGMAAALVLWAPPLRRRLDALADLVSGVFDRLAGRALHRSPSV